MRSSSQRALIIVGLGLLAVEGALLLTPLRNLMMRTGMVVVPLLLVAVMAALARHVRILRVAPVGLLIFLLMLLLVPRQAYDAHALRDEYVRSLRRYEGSAYFWGGETARGIDCSGLVRQGLVDALVQHAFVQVNPWMLRRAFSQWWTDQSAYALGDPRTGATSLLFTATSLTNVPDDALQPGDLAVTENGAHVLAYLGQGLWIQADPSVNLVHVAHRTSTNPWFGMPVRLMRWHELVD